MSYAFNVIIAYLAGMACGWLLFACHQPFEGNATITIVNDGYVEHIPKPTENIIDAPAVGSMRVAMP